MRCKSIFPISIFILLGLSSNPVLSSSAEDFDTATQYFEQGNFEQALVHFKRAAKSSMANPQLNYNLGSVYYKLTQFENSKRHFEQLIGDEYLGPLSYYNLGLIEHKRGNDRIAISQFQKCIESSDDSQLKALAQEQINTLRNLSVKP